MIVDYHRRQFSLSQATAGNGQPPNIIPILPSDKGTLHHSRTLSKGGYAGIGVGVGTAMITIGFLIFSWTKNWPPFRKRRQKTEEDRYEKPELGGKLVPRTYGTSEAMERDMAELETHEPKLEAMGRERLELETCEPRVELGEVEEQIEIPSIDELHEMDARTLQPEATERGEVLGRSETRARD